MCGLAAIFAYSPDAPNVERDELIAIRERMKPRGPDGAGEWICPKQRIGLAHRRLSIIDLSEAGAQPMWNADKTLCVIFNGEIYNCKALRSEFQARGCIFRSNSDTEVLLHLYAAEGQEMVCRLRGMYVFVIWDMRKRTLFAARDPFGIKPLYYANDGRTIRLASQIKALLQTKHIDTTPEPAGHVGFFLWGSVPDPFTLYRGIVALEAGQALAVSESGKVQLHSFCSIPEVFRTAERTASESDRPLHAEERCELLRTALADTVRHHLVADVPVGIFQSAGLDSSTLTAFVSQEHSDVRTVTLGFREFQGTENDEVPLAEAVSRACRANHQTILVSRSDFENAAEHLFDSMDGPSIDGVNTYFVSFAARRAGLKVALSGLGGDELFGGYPSFKEIPKCSCAMQPFAAIPGFGRAFRVVSMPLIKRLTSPKYAGIFEYGSTYGGAYLLRRSLFAPWELPHLLHAEVVREGWKRLGPLLELDSTAAGINSPRGKVCALELCWYMRHQLLRDADWAGMAHSLEIRVPFVDVTLLRALGPLLVSKLPPTKRDVAASSHVTLPDAVLVRSKTGFIVPIRDWLLHSFDPLTARERGLRGWAREIYSRFANPLELHRMSMRHRHARRVRRYSASASHFNGHPDESNASLRVLVLLTDGFGGFGGIAKFNRDLLTALCSHPQISEVIALPRLMPEAPGPLPPKLTHVTEGLGGKLRYLCTVIKTASRIRSRDRGTHLSQGPNPSLASAPQHEPLILCGHIHLLPAALIAKQICGGTIHLVVYGIDAWTPTKNPITNACVRFIDGFISISNVTRQRFKRWAKLRSDQGVVLPCCVDVSAFTPGPKSSPLLQRYGLENKRVILTVGRLASEERYKGFDEVLEILPALAQSIPGIRYLVCGDGPDRNRLVGKAKSLGLTVLNVAGNGAPRRTFDPQPSTLNSQPVVIFTGRIPESEKADHYRLAHAYVMPSSGEGFGIVYLEALACGIPVIGSKADGSREALREGKLGVLVDPQNREELQAAIIDVLKKNEDESDGARLHRHAGIEYFSFPVFERRVHEIIDAIIPPDAGR